MLLKNKCKNQGLGVNNQNNSLIIRRRAMSVCKKTVGYFS
jgi:hypothetical protein